METKKTICQLHEEHTTWLNKLAYYKDELSINISEIAQKNKSKEVLSFVKHFQNQLIVKKEQIDILSHTIRSNESFFENAANKDSIAIDYEKFTDHNEQRENVEKFEQIFNDLRKELIGFLSKWM